MYREAEFDEGCVECGKPSKGRCARCGDPCCDRHVYSDDGTCRECETEYLAVSGRERGPGTLTGALVGAGVSLSAVLGAMGLGLVGAVIGGVGIGVFAALGHLGGKKRRRAYLEERRKLFLTESTSRQRR